MHTRPTTRPPMRATLAFSTLACLVAAPALAQPTIQSFTIDSGGQVTTGGTLRLTSTIGQSDAGGPFGSGSFVVRGGFVVPRPCAADFNLDGTPGIADIFAFLTAWFAGSPSADFNGVGGVTVADIFAFLTAWFAGCP